MFKQSEIDAYQSIGAPKALKDSICNMTLSASKPKVIKWVRPLAAVAACLAVIIGSSFFYMGRPSMPEIYLNEELLTENAVYLTEGQSGQNAGIAMARSMPVGLSISLLMPKEISALTVSGGVVSQTDDTHYNWEIVQIDRADAYELLFQEKNITYKIVLQFDEDAKKWALHLEREKE